MEKFTLRKEVIFIQEKPSKNNITLLIPKTLSEDHNISNYAITSYCLLQVLSVPCQLPLQCITYHQLVYYLTGEMSQQRNKITDYIKCGINELEDKEIISRISEFSKHYILDCSKLWINSESGHFTKITFGEVQKIFSIKNINNFLLLRYFIFLMGTLSGKITVYLENGDYKNSVVGNFTIDYLANKSGISDRSIIEYNKLLEKEKLIYIYRQKDFVIDEDNTLKSLSNVYGRYSDMEYVNAFAKNQRQHKESYHYKKNNQIETNNKRRLAQMYQQLLKGRNVSYSNEEIIDIYNYVISENQKYERMYEKNKFEDYLDKIRDTDIFEKYDFLQLKNREVIHNHQQHHSLTTNN